MYPLRSAWRNLNSNLEKQKSISTLQGNSLPKISAIEEYMTYITSKLVTYCTDCLDTVIFLLSRYAYSYYFTYPTVYYILIFLLRENNSEAYVFFKKMEADYNRYIGEVSTGEEKEKAINLAKVKRNININTIPYLTILYTLYFTLYSLI